MRGTESGKERFKKFANYSGVVCGSAFASTHFGRSKDSGIKDLFGGGICTMMSPGGSIVASFEYVESFFAVHTPPDHLIRTDFEQEGVIPEGTINLKSNRSKSLEGKCFCDFLVLKFILMRVLKSGKMISGQILCSLFVSDDNIEFLEQKDPPHQSWLSILFSEEILYSKMVSIHYALGQNEI
ncbi:hypothetical protein Tco_1283132 [Tanacetum coccineum]